MKAEYRAWIDGHVTTVQAARGQCRVVSQQMADVFPELRVVRGHYVDCLIGRRPHWWLVAKDGEIVDPTAIQFAPCGDYEEWDESRPEPTGKCHHCGEPVYDQSAFCSRKCREKADVFMRESREIARMEGP